MKKQPQKEYYIPIKGTEMIKKKVGKSGNSGYIYVPVRWAGKEVTIIFDGDAGDDLPSI